MEKIPQVSFLICMLFVFFVSNFEVQSCYQLMGFFPLIPMGVVSNPQTLILQSDLCRQTHGDPLKSIDLCRTHEFSCTGKIVRLGMMDRSCKWICLGAPLTSVGLSQWAQGQIWAQADLFTSSLDYKLIKVGIQGQTEVSSTLGVHPNLHGCNQDQNLDFFLDT